MTLAEKHLPDWMIEFARLEHHVEAALAYSGGTHGVEDVFKGIAAGQYQVWTGEDSIIVTEVAETPLKTVCHYFLAGGNLDEIEGMVEPIEQWARKQGCTDIGLAGRKGWHRTFLRNRGYTPRWYVMGKAL